MKRCAHKVLHRWITRAHLLQHLFGGDAAIHQPNPPRLAVLAFDAREKILQRRVIRRVAGEHLIGERKALRRDDQRNHHLHAVGTMITRVTERRLS